MPELFSSCAVAAAGALVGGLIQRRMAEGWRKKAAEELDLARRLRDSGARGECLADLVTDRAYRRVADGIARESTRRGLLETWPSTLATVLVVLAMTIAQAAGYGSGISAGSALAAIMALAAYDTLMRNIWRIFPLKKPRGEDDDEVGEEHR